MSAPGFLHGLSSTESKSTSVMGWPLYSPTSSNLMPPWAVLGLAVFELDVPAAVVDADDGLPCSPGLIFTGVSFSSVAAAASLLI